MLQQQLIPYQKVFLKKAEQVVDSRITDSGFTVEEFSQMMGLSRSQLFRKLKETTNRSVSVFIRDRRLKYATQLLKEGELHIAQIAVKAGFSSETYFRKCFKETFGVTPGEYARNRTDTTFDNLTLKEGE